MAQVGSLHTKEEEQQWWHHWSSSNCQWLCVNVKLVDVFFNFLSNYSPVYYVSYTFLILFYGEPYYPYIIYSVNVITYFVEIDIVNILAYHLTLHRYNVVARVPVPVQVYKCQYSWWCKEIFITRVCYYFDKGLVPPCN